jgi:hypothetical protein
MPNSAHFGHLIGYLVYRMEIFLLHPHMVFAYKVGVLAGRSISASSKLKEGSILTSAREVLTAIPAYVQSSAKFYYYQRGTPAR